MLKPLIDNADVYLATLGLRTHGLAERVEVDGNNWPCVYSAQGELKQVNPEVPGLYHRVLGGPSRNIDEDASPLSDDAIMTLAWSMRAVAIFPYNLYCVDDYALEDKVIRNVMNALNLASTKAIATALSLSVVGYEASDSGRNKDAWEEEFGTAYTGQLKIIYVDYSLEVQGFESCFTALGCDDEQINIIDVIIDNYCTNDGPCNPALITVNGDSPALEVASGATQDITVRNSAATAIGTRTGAAVTIGDSQIQLNGVNVATTPATVTKDIDVKYENGTDVGSLVGSVWTIPNPASPALLSAELMKTNQTTSYRTGDDGDLQKGRPTDFLTLSAVNNFGNLFRFTGITGGYQDSAGQYKDAAGTNTTLALAFPNDVALDWSTYNGSTVQGWYMFTRPSATWNNAIDAALTFSVGTFTSGWYMANVAEIFSVSNWGCVTGFGNRMNYRPFNIGSTDLWTSNTPTFNTTLAIYYNASTTLAIFTLAKTQSRVYMVTRKFNVSGTTIT